MDRKQVAAWGVVGVVFLSWVGFFVFFEFSDNGAFEVQVKNHL